MPRVALSLLATSVRRGGNRVRISAQLIEPETGTHLWADHSDGSLEDVFDLQDKVATSVAGVIELALQAAETARHQTSDLRAYDLYLRAFAMFFTSQRHMREALALLEEAIRHDPQYAAALGFAALCCHLRPQTPTPRIERRSGRRE
jgi:adenylate cyclase